MPAPAYPWYSLAEGDKLQQGDILRNCPVFSPDVTSETIKQIRLGCSPDTPVNVDIVDVIVLSQSCDLENDKIESVILCPVWNLCDFEEVLGANAKERAKRKEDIRRGREPAFHMLAADSNVSTPLSVVEFKRIYTTPKSMLRAFANTGGQRPRLLPPYREHLSQAFARYFMRVGLPNDIRPFN